VNSHLSGPRVTAQLKQPTRIQCEQQRGFLFGLAPSGVYPAIAVTGNAVRSYRTFSPLPYCLRRCIFCGTSRKQRRIIFTAASQTLSGALLCGVRTFLATGKKPIARLFNQPLLKIACYNVFRYFFMVMKKLPNNLRIIGGKWRGRKLRFSAIQALRPTLNRARETLFNWLAPIIVDKICLDLFAGSGALGFEALSRGAKQVTMVDKSIIAINNLRKNAEMLGADNVEFFGMSFSPKLKNIFNHKFDLVFLDPPFYQGLASKACNWLESQKCLADSALIYLEAEKDLTDIKFPSNWKILRHKTEGKINYFLFEHISEKS
jgi:16S rRNA (guanine966-N2)-methyltransferase